MAEFAFLSFTLFAFVGAVDVTALVVVKCFAIYYGAKATYELNKIKGKQDD